MLEGGRGRVEWRGEKGGMEAMVQESTVVAEGRRRDEERQRRRAMLKKFSRGPGAEALLTGDGGQALRPRRIFTCRQGPPTAWLDGEDEAVVAAH